MPERGKRVRQWRISLTLSALGGITIVLSACGGGDGDVPPTVGPTATVAATTAAAAAAVEPIVWTKAVDAVANTPLEPVEQYSSADPTIYGVVRVANLSAGAVLSASWAYNEVPLESASRAVIPSQPY